MTSLIYKQHNFKKSAHHKNNLLAHRVSTHLTSLKLTPLVESSPAGRAVPILRRVFLAQKHLRCCLRFLDLLDFLESCQLVKIVSL